MNAAPPQLAQFSTVAKATPSLAGMAIRKQEVRKRNVISYIHFISISRVSR